MQALKVVCSEEAASTLVLEEAATILRLHFCKKV